MNEITNCQTSEIVLPQDFEYPNLIRPWMCFDTETTGFTKFDDILQLSLIDFKGETINEFFNTRPKVNQLKRGGTSITRKRTWKKSMAVHHITPEMVCDKLSLIERKDEFRAKFKEYSIVLGYNVAFDVRMITSNIWYSIEKNSAVIDVLNLWKKFKTKHNIETENNKLITASKYFGWDYTDYAHNALADVYATIYVLQKIIEDEEFYMECLNAKKTYTPKNSNLTKPKTKPKTSNSNFQKNENLENLNLLDFEEDEEPSLFSDIEDFDEENPF